MAWSRFAAQSKQALAAHEVASSTAPLAPAPEGVTDLSFAEFFGPIGDRGLEYSAKVRSLAGHRVRMVGYMVREPGKAPGRYRLAGWPVVVEASALCSVDDTPPNVAYVVLPGDHPPVPAWQPGRLVLIGTLEFGPHLEGDERNSFVRLILDAPAPIPSVSTSAPSPSASTSAP